MCKHCKNLNRNRRDFMARKLLCDALNLLGYKFCDNGLKVDLSDTLNKSYDGGFRYNEMRFVMNVLEFLNSK